MTYRCPACRFPHLSRSPERLAPWHGCPSCGYMFGITTEYLGITSNDWRRRWIARGMPWTEEFGPPPLGWDPLAQLTGRQAPRTIPSQLSATG